MNPYQFLLATLWERVNLAKIVSRQKQLWVGFKHISEFEPVTEASCTAAGQCIYLPYLTDTKLFVSANSEGSGATGESTEGSAQQTAKSLKCDE